MSDEPIKIPTIKGRIAERLAREPARGTEDGPLAFPDSPGDVLLHSADERGVVALACLLLENLREHGGTRAPARPLDTILRRVLETFGPKEVMDIEVEAYEILLWIGRAIDDEWEPERLEAPGAISPGATHAELIRWSIAGGVDLEMDYYSHGRGELTHRRVSPISLEAEVYFHAYCHLRRDERVFRLSRIGSLKPVGGWPRQRAPRTPDEPAPRKTPQKPVDERQMSLLDE